MFIDDFDYGGTGWILDCGHDYARLEDYRIGWSGFPWCIEGPCAYRVSSIKVPKGCRVTLYSDFYFRGDSTSFTTDQPNLGAWNDRALSIRIYDNDKPAETCGGIVHFTNRSKKKVYLFGIKKSKYTPEMTWGTGTEIYFPAFFPALCDHFIKALKPGETTDITIEQGEKFYFSLNLKRKCRVYRTKNEVSSGAYLDCDAGKTHYIDF